MGLNLKSWNVIDISIQICRYRYRFQKHLSILFLRSIKFLHWKILFRKVSWLLSFSYSISLPNFHLMRIIYFMFFLLHLLLSEITICNENFYVVNLIWYHKFTIIYIKIHTLTHKPQLLNINDHAISSFLSTDTLFTYHKHLRIV